MVLGPQISCSYGFSDLCMRHVAHRRRNLSCGSQPSTLEDASYMAAQPKSVLRPRVEVKMMDPTEIYYCQKTSCLSGSPSVSHERARLPAGQEVAACTRDFAADECSHIATLHRRYIVYKTQIACILGGSQVPI